jgi:hypothetical protein
MKTKARTMTYNRCKANSGSVLVAALIFALAIATTLVSYLWLVQNSDQTVARAQRWNSALAMAESGVEDGMANLNSRVSLGDTNTVLFNPTVLSNNITIGITGSYIGSYSSTNNISNVTNNVITSTGFVPAPLTGGTISRTVQVIATRNDLLTKGVVAMQGVVLSGNANDPVVDSYDSRLGFYNRNNHLWNGGIAVENGDLGLANHQIGGSVYLGDGVTISGNTGSVTGTTNYGWSVPYPDAAFPAKDANGNALVDANGNPILSMWPDAPGDPTSHTFTTSGYYTIRDTGDLHVLPGVTVTLDVKVSNYDFHQNQNVIDIQGGTTNAATLIIYQESGTATFGSQNSSGAINNQPINFQYFGLPGVTTINVNGGNSNFQGVFYAPEADLYLNGGSGSDINFMGAFVVRTLTDKGHFLIHYDQSLNGKLFGYYLVSSWKEL